MSVRIPGKRQPRARSARRSSEAAVPQGQQISMIIKWAPTPGKCLRTLCRCARLQSHSVAVHLTRCLRTLRARLHLLWPRAARAKGSSQSKAILAIGRVTVTNLFLYSVFLNVSFLSMRIENMLLLGSRYLSLCCSDRSCLACRAARGPLAVLPSAKRPRGAGPLYETCFVRNANVRQDRRELM